MTSSTENPEGYIPPAMKDLDNPSLFIQSVPTFIRNTALRFLQTIYSQNPKGQLRYCDDEEETDIKIADQFAFDLDAAHIKPAIIAVRGTINWSKVGMNHGMHSLDMRTGRSEHSGQLHSSVGLSCISRVGLEAEQIASDVFNLFKVFKPTLMRYGFFTVESMSMGPEQLVEVAGEAKLFMVSVVIGCQIQDGWTMAPKAAAELDRMIISTFVGDSKMTENNLEGGA